MELGFGIPPWSESRKLLVFLTRNSDRNREAVVERSQGLRALRLPLATFGRTFGAFSIGCDEAAQ